MSGVYIFDTEQTGKKDGEIIEAAWIAIKSSLDLLGESGDIQKNLAVTNMWSGRYKPTKPITYGAMAVHHILPHELEACPPSSQFSLPADCQYLIGHSIDFDWKAAGSPAHIKRICTHALAQWVWQDADSYSLSALIYKLLGPTDDVREMLKDAHSAVTDTYNNLTLLEYILKEKPEIRTWDKLWEFSEECRIPRLCPRKKYEGYTLDQLDTGYIQWELNLTDLDPYYRKGLERVMKKRYSGFDTEIDDEDPASVVG